ncbi:hypothetical protein TrVE_jg12174 [Triparma verrucosa]|uniref:Protein kinase domain-containing protein n=1 Tax=Triparma verrucosa TaxID=1606542 RepID=A0A9W7EX53_9STRA|nr:hypothetical protein TrVE_jg12174 [Triparma verrucosa]
MMNVETDDKLFRREHAEGEGVKDKRERMKDRKIREVQIQKMEEEGHPMEEIDRLYGELEAEWLAEGDWPDDDHIDNHYQVDHTVKQPYGDMTLLGQGGYRGVWLTPHSEVYKTVYGYHSTIKYSENHGDVEAQNDKISFYSSEIIAMIEMGNFVDDTYVLGVTGVSCSGSGYDGSFTQKGGEGMLLLRSHLDMIISSGHSPTQIKKAKLDILIDAAKGLTQIHKHNVIHVDIKTNQFVVDGDATPPRVYLQDFNNAIYMDVAIDGTACPTSQSDHFDKSGKLRSPEEYNGLYLDTKIDIFSFGYVMYEVLTGEVPWRHEKRMRDSNNHVVETRKAVAMGFKHPIHKEGMEEWELEVARIVEDCWEYDKKDRPEAEIIVRRLQKIKLGTNYI